MSEVNAAEAVNAGPVNEGQETVNPEESTTLAEAAGAAGDEGEPQGEGESKPEHKRKGGWQRQIEKLKAQNEALIDALTRGVGPKEPEAPKPAADAEPDPDTFETLKDYLKAHAEWTKREAKREAIAEWKKEQEASQKKTEEQKQAEVWQERLAKAKAEIPNFDDALEAAAEIPATETMAAIIRASELGPHMLMHFVENEAEAARISKLSPAQQAYELGKIEARIAGQKSQPAPEAKPAPVVSKAPAPAKPVERPSASKSVDIYDPNLPYKEFVKAREAKQKG